MLNHNSFLVFCLFFLLILFSASVNAQKVLNTTGKYLRTDDYNLSYSVGEMAIQTLQGNTGFVTQGVLQPIFAFTPSGPLVTLPLPRAVCLGESVEVAFSTVLKFNDDNEFTLELSDREGSFDGSTVIGRVKGTSVRKIPVNLPSDLDVRKTYYLRVRSSSPAADGRSTNLLVRIKPTADFKIDDVVCAEDTVVATFTGKDTLANSNYRWYFDGSALFEKAKTRYQQGFVWKNITKDIKDTVSLVIDNNGCVSDPIRKVVTIKPRLSRPRLSCGKLSGNSITFNWAQVSGANSYRIIRAAYPDTVVKTNSLTFKSLAQKTTLRLEVQALGDGPCGFNRDTLSCVTLDCPVYQANFIKNQDNICAGSVASTELQLLSTKPTQGAYNIIYSANGGKQDTTRIYAGEPLSFRPEQTTTYNIIAIDNESFDGCYTPFNKLIYQVNVAQNNNPGQAEPPQLVCNNQNNPIILADLLKGEDNNGKWSVLPEIKTDAFDPDAGTFVPKAFKPGIYFFKYTVPRKTASCLERSSIVQINLEQKLEVEIKDYSNCLDANGKTTVNLKTVALRTNRFAPNLVRWYYDAALKDTVKQEQIEVAAPLTLYAFVGQGKCASAPSPVTLKPGAALPVPKIEGANSLKTGERILLSSSSSFPPGSLFIWKTPDTIASGTDLYNFPVRLATKQSEGRYSLQVRGPQEPGKPSCESPLGWLDVVVFNPEDPILKIGKVASATTPWKIEGIDQYPQHKITVVNRLGRVVFEVISTYSNNWYGTYNGKPLPQATYYYQIETGEADKKPIQGAVYIIR